MRRLRAAALAAAALTASLITAGEQPAAAGYPRPQPSQVGVEPSGPQRPGGAVTGTAWKADNTPLPGATIVLRGVDDGREAGMATTDAKGQFTFGRVAPGPYIVELRSRQGRVLAVSDLFLVSEGRTATTFVRLSARAPWFTGFFGNTAAAAIAAASSVGITALGSSGLPASPQ
jgi:hypothetical protein